MLISSSTMSLSVGILHQRLRRLPGLCRRRHVARFVLRLPGEAFAKRMPAHHVAEAFEHAPLAGVPRALDELHHGAFPAIADHAQHEAEGRGRFALAGAGMDDEQSLLGIVLAATSASCAALRFAILARWRSCSSCFTGCRSWQQPSAGMASPATMSRTLWALTASC